MAFGKSMMASDITFQNLMYPDSPEKDGVYFYRGKMLVGFVPVPRVEGVSMVPDLMKD